MIIGCKDDTRCEDIEDNNCCIDCSKFIECAEPCIYLLDGETNRDKIITFCKLSKVKWCKAN